MIGDVAAIPQPAEIPEDAVGVWQVPALGTSSPLYYGTGNGQDTVDRENAALIRSYGRGRVILDHADSRIQGGIWNVNGMTVGAPAFLIQRDRTRWYTCTAIWKAKQTAYAYWFNNAQIYPLHSADILCASCTPEPGMVYLAYYSYEGEMP